MHQRYITDTLQQEGHGRGKECVYRMTTLLARSMRSARSTFNLDFFLIRLTQLTMQPLGCYGCSNPLFRSSLVEAERTATSLIPSRLSSFISFLGWRE